MRRLLDALLGTNPSRRMRLAQAGLVAALLFVAMAVLQPQRYPAVLELGHFDIDHFKAVNEAHGYAVGDAVLRAVSQEALRHVRVADLLARWGGEEFALMLPDTRVAV